MTLRLEGRRILVTGASRGIGRAVAEALAHEGAELVLVARDIHRLQDVAEDLPGGGHLPLRLDVRDAAAWNAAHDRIAPDGVLHGIVTAAATVDPIGPVGSWSVEQFRATVDTNLVGTLLPIAALLREVADVDGSIVTFSGGGATSPLAKYDAYAASKAAVVRLTENLAVDLRGRGVRCNSVAPGFVATRMHEATLSAGPQAAGTKYYEKTRAAMEGGTGDSPELAAALVVFLMSDQSAGITGKLISARWDPWQNGEFQERLRTEPNLATLRRIDDQFFTTA